MIVIYEFAAEPTFKLRNYFKISDPIAPAPITKGFKFYN